MNNYEYIIASLPVLQSDSRAQIDTQEILSQIEEQLSGRDRRSLNTLLKGFDTESLDAGFYISAASDSSAFIRGYFDYDLGVRNCKVEYLNAALGRPAGQDILSIEEEPSEMEDREKVQQVLSRTDILERERGLDDLMWDKIDELTSMQVFTLDVILGFVAKLQIINRWLRLDPQRGRELFRQLVEEIRNNKKENSITI